ncbi:MAG: DUF4332 domain-containing protein [Cyanothece sp. SIO1E1]|nr:DUF4332 domain-containing protein [Cyanothece sp. SIO1E1]
MSSSQQFRSNSLKPSNWQIKCLPGLSCQNQARLIEAGIKTTAHLLHQGNTVTQRRALATQLQLHIQHINKWVALADLSRIPSVGCQYCGLLLHAGISSTAQLSQIPLNQLHKQILKLQVKTLQRPDLCPKLEQMAQWVQQANLLINSGTKTFP